MNPSPLLITKTSPTLRVTLLALTAVLLSLGAGDALWLASADFAHHYALVARLSELWQLPLAPDHSLGEMNIYPRLSHQIAAVLGRVLGSPLLGMQGTALMSLAVIWSCFAAMLVSLPRRAGVAAALTFAVLLLLFARVLHLDMHGAEITGNYFYAQLVAQAMALGLLGMFLYFDGQGMHPALRHALLLPALYVLASAHLLAAMHMLAFTLALTSFDTMVRLQANKKRMRNILALAGATSVLAVLVVLRHPAYAAMKAIAAHDGVLETAWINSAPKLGAYALLIALLSAWLLRLWTRLDAEKRNGTFLVIKYAGLYGLAVGGLCLAQCLALKLTIGSLYAVKKHIFALNSACVFVLALLAAMAWQSRPARALSSRNQGVVYTYITPLALSILAFFAILPPQAGQELHSLVKLERQLELRRELVLPQEGKDDMLLGLTGQSHLVEYALSLGILRTAREYNGEPLLRGTDIDWTRAGTIITSTGSDYDRDPACLLAPPAAGLSMLKGSCLRTALQKPRTEVRFTSAQGSSYCKLEGFANAEDFGTWTIAREATVHCPMPAGATSVEIDSLAFVADKHPQQRVLISVNGQAAQEAVYTIKNTVQTITLPIKSGTELVVTLTMPDATTPKALGMSEDARLIGFGLRAIKFK